MKYDFTSIIDRRGKDAMAVDAVGKFPGLMEPEKGFAASASGLALWSETVLPSLLPFMILSNFIMTGGCIQKLFGRFPRL